MHIPNHRTESGIEKPSPAGGNLWSYLFLIGSCRLVLNTARRFAYPFAPAISRGLNVPLNAVTAVIALNQLAGLAVLLLGPIGDRIGYRAMMLGGLGLMGAGMLIGAIFPVYGGVLTALALAGLGKGIFDPAIQADIGDKIPYERRALVVGLIEMSWAGSTLVGIPLIGLLIETLGWRSAFWLLGVLGVAGALALAMVPASTPGRRPPSAHIPGVGRAWSQLLRNRHAVTLMVFAFMLSAGNDVLFVSFGVWFEDAFQLRIAALGMGAALIGVAELGGECLTALLGDRLRKKSAIIGGLIVAATACALLPLAGTSLPMALAALFAVFLSTEFAIVISLSLTSEIIPGSRATMMSAYFAAAGMGRVAGAILGGLVWEFGGITLTAGISAALSLAACAGLHVGLTGDRRW